MSVFWWRTDEPAWAEAALWPLSVASLAYRAGAALARGSVRPVRAGAPVISIGNLVVGGAGKTPVALELAERLLRRGKQPALLSRGYGRRARRPVEISEQTPFALAGDEPLLLKRRCPRLRVLVGPRRAVLASQAPERAATLQGAVDAVVPGVADLLALRTATDPQIEAALDPPVASRRREEGRRMSEEEATAFAATLIDDTLKALDASPT